MDKFIHSVFDFLAHAFPGFCLVFYFFLYSKGFNSMSDIMTTSDLFSKESIGVMFVVGYLIGFGIHPIGRYLYRRLGKKIWPIQVQGHVEMPISDKYVMVREKSKENFKYIETWNLFCAMSHNLALVSAIIFIHTLINLLFDPQDVNLFLIVLSIVTGLLSVVLLHRAVVFSVWAANDLNATVRLIKSSDGINKHELKIEMTQTKNSQDQA